MYFVRILCVGVALITALRAEVGIGDIREEVVRTLPKPTSIAKRGDHEIFMFPNGGRIEFVEGRISDIKGPLPKPLAKPGEPDVANAPAVAAAPAPTKATPAAAPRTTTA